jgi:hypothetical protein
MACSIQSKTNQQMTVLYHYGLHREGYTQNFPFHCIVGMHAAKGIEEYKVYNLKGKKKKSAETGSIIRNFAHSMILSHPFSS